MTEPCGHPAEPGRKRCRECRRRPGALRPSRTAERPGGKGKRANIYAALTPAEWVAVYDAQGGKCAICECILVNRYDPGPQDPDAKIANCDHSHALEKTLGLRASIRGLLCLWCNKHILVALHDSVAKAQNAADYLRDPPARRVLALDASNYEEMMERSHRQLDKIRAGR